MLISSSKSILEPNWVSLDRLRGSLLPNEIAPWVTDKGSLTKTIIHKCHGSFDVRVQNQSWSKAKPTESAILGISKGIRTMLREVELRCDDEPWIFARTLIPSINLKGGAKRLAFLKNRPLGAVLFADPNTKRLLIEVAKIDSRHDIFYKATNNLNFIPSELWGRRTLFVFSGKKLLVNEIFLPTLPKT